MGRMAPRIATLEAILPEVAASRAGDFGQKKIIFVKKKKKKEPAIILGSTWYLKSAHKTPADWSPTGGGGWQDGLGSGRGQTIGVQEGEDRGDPQQRLLVPQPAGKVSWQWWPFKRLQEQPPDCREFLILDPASWQLSACWFKLASSLEKLAQRVDSVEGIKNEPSVAATL